MTSKRKQMRSCSGIALVAALIFLAVFCAMSAGMFSLSTGNAQVARNHQAGNGAFCSAQSGFEIVRYLLDGAALSSVPGSDGKIGQVYTELQSRLTSTSLSGCIQATLNSSVKTINIANVPLADGKTFNIEIAQDADDEDIMHTRITGADGVITRNIRADFDIAERPVSVFDYGIASKGPLLMGGQASVAGVNLAVESDIFIDTSTIGDSFKIIGQASVGGNVHIVNRYASFRIEGPRASVGGETGAAAADNVHVGVDPVDFPTPNVEYFRQFATGPTITSSTDISSLHTIDNAIVAANTNPTFASGVQVNGILFIEQPNHVTFAGRSSIRGIIVGVSDVGDTSGTNTIRFSGQVTCQDTSTLEGEQFAAIKNEKGTFLMAPGYVANFTGQANLINGVIAVSSRPIDPIDPTREPTGFTGQAGGTINGSIINYGNADVSLDGQSELLFNRSGLDENISGFTPVKRLSLDKTTYSEI